ncbi:MAG: hypothetical protein Q8P41_17980 [Pseudomonadota bacterium]|nr:hypothetical protein [Pseudomonadota bacterium]
MTADLSVSPITGPGADWLPDRRVQLNERFERARRRTPALDPADTLARLATAIPGLAGPEPAAARLLDVVYDLVLLHAGRGAFARHPGLAVLLEETFPALRPALLAAPVSLPGALSNAVENLGAVGEAWARALPGVVATLGAPVDAATLLDAGAVLAWRLGEARLRVGALERARALPVATVRAALKLGDVDVPAVLARLTTDAWNDPLGPSDKAWRRVGVVGGFAGFGGPFEAPPRVLDGGEPHVFHVVSGGRHFRVDADRYGASARPEPDPGRPMREPRQEGFLGGLLAPKGEWAEPDGTFHLAEGKLPVPEEAGLDSWTRVEHVIAVARRDSHQLHIYARGSSR